MFVLRDRRGNAIHVAGQASLVVPYTVGNQLQFFGIKLLGSFLKMLVCCCAVLSWVLTAQGGSRAGIQGGCPCLVCVITKCSKGG